MRIQTIRITRVLAQAELDVRAVDEGGHRVNVRRHLMMVAPGEEIAAVVAAISQAPTTAALT